MDKRNSFKIAIDSLIDTIAKELVDADAMLTLACLLEDAAHRVRVKRLDMTIEPELRCFDCGRRWTNAMTVARLNSSVPDNCPECYNKSKPGNHSCWTETFRFLDSGKAEPNE